MKTLISEAFEEKLIFTILNNHKKIIYLAKKNVCDNINFMRDYTGTPRNQTLV